MITKIGKGKFRYAPLSFLMVAVITIDELIIWYEKTLRGRYLNILGERVISTLSNEIKTEFPSVGSNDFQTFKKIRGYDKLSSTYWNINT